MDQFGWWWGETRRALESFALSKSQGSPEPRPTQCSMERKRAFRNSETPLERESRLLGAEDRVFGGFRHAELHDLLGGDLDLRAGGGIAANSGLAIHED